MMFDFEEDITSQEMKMSTKSSNQLSNQSSNQRIYQSEKFVTSIFL
jgi:hypothetical protein